MRIDLQPVVLIDTRERKALEIRRFAWERATLPAGDYGIRGFSDLGNPQFAVERKALDDLVSSLTFQRPRFLREAHLLARFRFAGLLIEGARSDIQSGAYRGLADPNAVLASVDMLALWFGIHVWWCDNAEGAAAQLEELVWLFVRGLAKDVAGLLPAGVTLGVAEGAEEPVGETALGVAG